MIIKEKKFLRYKEKKIKHFITKKKFLFFCYSSNYNRKKTIEVESNLKKDGFQSYKVFNKSLKIIIVNSVFKNFLNFVTSPVFVVTPINKFKTKLLNKNSSIDFKILGLKVNNKLYVSTVIESLTEFVYKKSAFTLFGFLKKIVKHAAKIEIM